MKIFKTSQEAWEWYNENLFKDKGFINYSHISLSYDNVFLIEKPRVDPNFDFARMFNYRINKWRSLINNYLSLPDLVEIKNIITKRNEKVSRIYQHTIKFSNNYKNGKDCLISLTFSKRANEAVPYIIFHTRALECTKRMLLDLLLVQRMGEYVYGKYAFKIIVYCPMIYLDGDTFTMYDNHKPIKDLELEILKVNVITGLKLTSLQERVLKSLKEFKTKPIDEISYKVNKRCAKQLQFDKYDGTPLGSGSLHLLAKDLKIKI